MRILLNMLAGAALATAVAVAPQAQAQNANEINFGIISTETTANLKSTWEPFLAAMAKGTGLKITGFYASDYAGVIEAQRFNKVQVAWYGNKSAMEAVDRSNGEVFAQSVDAHRQSRILVAPDRAQGLADQHPRRRPQMRQVARFRHRRPELDLGLPCADDLHFRGQEHRPEAMLQDGAQRLA